MNTRRFAFDRRPGAASRPKAREFPKWIRVTHLSGPVLHDSESSGRRRIFAIVAPPKVDVSGNAIRRILIFDNHPESLRLVSSLRARPDVDLAATRRAHPVYLIFALLLMLTLSIAMFWPLIMWCNSL
jgi:hypothetical protein